MVQRIQSHRSLFNDRPFNGTGTSAYANLGSTVRYRDLRVLHLPKKYPRRSADPLGPWIKGQGGVHDIAAGITKTARRGYAADPTASIPIDVSDLIPATGTAVIALDVRTYKDDVENESDNNRIVTKTIDTSGDEINAILGAATLLDQEVRAGGVVRIRFLWSPSVDGTQPTQFRLTRTAGPSSPPDVVQLYSAGNPVEILTAALSDASAYTFRITAENGAVTADVLAGISVTADATGPAAPTHAYSTDPV